MDRVGWIEATLRRVFAPRHLAVQDESARHAGHVGAAGGGGGHFRVVIVSDAFEGLSPVARHTAVYTALGGAMRSDIHALALRTLTPDEWARDKANAFQG